MTFSTAGVLSGAPTAAGTFVLTAQVADSDGDGASNRAEYLAGTDPQNAASHLSITDESIPAAGQFTITWPGIAGKIYQLSTSPDLATWTPLTPLQLATATQTVTIETAGAIKLFVRVEITPERGTRAFHESERLPPAAMC